MKIRIRILLVGGLMCMFLSGAAWGMNPKKTTSGNALNSADYQVTIENASGIPDDCVTTMNTGIGTVVETLNTLKNKATAAEQELDKLKTGKDTVDKAKQELEKEKKDLEKKIKDKDEELRQAKEQAEKDKKTADEKYKQLQEAFKAFVKNSQEKLTNACTAATTK